MNKILIAACLLAFFSCKKDDTTFDKAKVQGTWTIVERGKYFKSIMTYLNYKEISSYSYLFQVPVGEITFDADSISTITGGDSMRVFEKTEVYKEEVLVDTFTTTRTLLVDILYTVSSYQWIGNDSIHGDPGRGLGVYADPIQPAFGGKFKWVKDTLVYTTIAETKGTFESALVTNIVTTKLKLIKKK